MTTATSTLESTEELCVWKFASCELGFSGQSTLSAVGWAERRSFSAFIKDCIRVHSKHDSEKERKDAVA